MLTLPELEIRPVFTEDFDEVCDIEQVCFKDPYPRYFLVQLAEANPDTFLVAVVDGRVVGYGVVDRWKDHNHLVSIAVLPLFRRRGIGQRLLDSLEKRLDRRLRLRLEVRKSNAPATSFYLKNEFREIGLLEGYYSDGEDAILMEKMPRQR